MKAFLAAMSGVSLLLYPNASGEMLPTERMAPMVLNGYSRFPRNIRTAPVYDLEGHRIGLIQKLDADPTGKPVALKIWLPSGHSVTVAASKVSYDQQDNILIAGLTDAQLSVGPLAPSPVAR